MEGSQRKDSQDGVSPKLRKYIRIQIVGMSIFVSWPVAIYLAGYFRLNINLGQLSALIIVAAVVVFCFGLVGRQELQQQRDRETKDR